MMQGGMGADGSMDMSKMQEMMKGNPGMEDMLKNNPDFISQSVEMLKSPMARP